MEFKWHNCTAYSVSLRKEVSLQRELSVPGAEALTCSLLASKNKNTRCLVKAQTSDYYVATSRCDQWTNHAFRKMAQPGLQEHAFFFKNLGHSGVYILPRSADKDIILSMCLSGHIT